MEKRFIKYFEIMLVFLMLFDVWLVASFKTELALYVLLFSILILFLIFILFHIKIADTEKKSIGINHVLEKSEEGRINAERVKNRIYSMIDDLPEGILMVDKDDKILVINSRAEKFLAINRRQVLNKPVLDLRHLSNVRKIVVPLVINSKASLKEEIELRKNFILELTIEPLVLGKSDAGRLIILRDITRIKHAEASKNQFVSITAHQLKSPLSAIRLSLKMLSQQDFGKINKEQRNVLEKAYKKIESLIYLVSDLLEEAKIDGVGNLDRKSLFNLEDLVAAAVDFYKEELRNKKIDFSFNKPEKRLPKVSADQEKIKMVIQNLFDNAIKYTMPKGRIEVFVRPSKEEVEFQIKDSGIGIPEDQKGKIFTRFSRAVNVNKAETVGSGLGLAIAKDIIEKHNGKIWFQSKENEGSTFFFSLPR